MLCSAVSNMASVRGMIQVKGAYMPASRAIAAGLSIAISRTEEASVKTSPPRNSASTNAIAVSFNSDDDVVTDDVGVGVGDDVGVGVSVVVVAAVTVENGATRMLFPSLLSICWKGADASSFVCIQNPPRCILSWKVTTSSKVLRSVDERVL